MAMTISDQELEAKLEAEKQVAHMLHAPDKLEKLSQLQFNAERKKASVEAMMKTAMQRQLDGVRTGLAQLHKASRDIKEVEGCMCDLDAALSDLPKLSMELSIVQEETLRHSQLATARENLKHIFNVPETVRQATAQITDGKLLDAHKALVELENSRDDLLFELHKLPKQSPSDKKLLKEYFEPVSELSKSLEKQLKFILMRTIITSRRDPKVLVTALRIIEREEKADQECLQRQKSTGFIPPGRPKNWKHEALDVLRNYVQEQIEGCQLEDSRKENKMWLVRSLERIRQVTLEDLRIAKSQCQPCFPSHYHILEHFIVLYHEALSNRLLDIVESGLEGQEYVTILSWIIQTYPGRELMGDVSLGIPAEKVRPLLDPDTLVGLQREYLENMQKNFREWMRNTLVQEAEDWKRDEDPDDSDGTFHTSAPIIVFQMVDENLQVAATISPELVHKVLTMSMGEVANYGTMYRSSIVDYKNGYFKDRNAITQFTKYMIAIVNNCQRFEELAQELKERWWRPGHHDNDALHKFEMLLKTFQELRTESSEYLLDESFLDIDVHFTEILSSKWQNTTDAIDTVCATLEDYFGDYKYLKDANRENVITAAMDRVARRYITSMLQGSLLKRKISFEMGEDRVKAADKIQSESKQLKAFFRHIAGDMADFDSPFDALHVLAELLKSDSDMLYLELGNLAKRYPDVSHEQLLCLLLLRGDLSRSEAKEMVSELVPEDSPNTGSRLHAKSIFSQVQVTSSLNPFATVEAKNPFTKESLNPFAKD